MLARMTGAWLSKMLFGQLKMLERRLPERRLYVNHVRNPFLLDGKSVRSQLACKVTTLWVSGVHGDENAIGNHIHMTWFGLNVDDMILSSIAPASPQSFTNERTGALVIDIGRGPDYALYRNNYAIRTGVVCVGGDHFTNDLSMGLRIKRSAEDLKREGTFAYDEIDNKQKVWLTAIIGR